MGTCECCKAGQQKEKEKRRKLRLKSSRLNKQLRADKEIRDAID
jgi:hypothetical protein